MVKILKVIGITGGIGSGKSTVAGIMKELGFKVIDADLVARSVTKKGEEAFNELVERFGKEILDSKGELDRRKLADIAFSDRTKLCTLNEITHRRVGDMIHRKIELLKKSGGYDMVAIDAPIPVEYGFLDIADEIWLVTANQNKRIERAKKRSDYSYKDIEARVDSQPQDEDYLKTACEVLENNGSIDELKEAAIKLVDRKRREWRLQVVDNETDKEK